MHLGGLGWFFFFLGRVMVLDFVVPNVFPMCSSSLQCVLQDVLNSSLFYPISFALSSTFVTYINSSKEEITTYLFWDFPKLD
jgi:hypothetical protein